MYHVVQRKALYALLAELFSYPHDTLMARLATPETHSLSAVVGRDLPAEILTASLSQLQTAYTGLFINRLGGVPAPPYGSVYLDSAGRIMGDSTARVASWYARFGLRQEEGGEPADHLATELEFLYYLVEREELALERRDSAAARAATLDQARFGAELFFPWCQQFCNRLLGATPLHPLYRYAGELFSCFAAAEERWLRQLHPAAFDQ